MPRISIALKLTATSHSSQGVQLFAAGKQWTSAPGGWLDKGTWTQGADGVRLKADSDGLVCAFCEALNFETCREGDRGNAHYPQIADAGKWEVVATNP